MATPGTAERLGRDRADTVQRITALRAELGDIIDSASSTTGDDEHDPEGSTIGFERAQAAALLAHAERRLDELDAAVQRVEAGIYGRCVVCGAAIGQARLEALPEATMCVHCAQSPHRRTARTP